MCSWLQSGNYGFNLNPGPEQCSRQRAKKVVSDSPGLVDFAIGQENSVFNSPDGQVMFLWNQFCSSKSFWVGLVEMTSALVNASFSLPEWQAVKMIFFPPCQGLLRNVKRRYSLGLQTTRTFACLGWQRWNEDAKMVSSVSTFTLNKLAVQLSIFIFLWKLEILRIPRVYYTTRVNWIYRWARNSGVAKRTNYLVMKTKNQQLIL